VTAIKHGAVNHDIKEYARYVCKSLTVPREHRRGLLAAVQGVGSLNACACQPQAHAALSDEFTFRANHRERVNGMFDLLVGAL
jgi:transposase